MAFALGFCAFRASICTVAAVGEVMSSRSAWVFASFLKVILWVTLINGLLDLWMPGSGRPLSAAPVDLIALAGGFIFGIGAGVNGGCSFSTISKIAQGNLHVALTLPAFVAGVVASAAFIPEMRPMPPMEVTPISEPWSHVVLLILALWGAWELVKIVSPNLRGEGLWRGLSSERYRLSTGAALIGICSGFLYTAHGRWAYSGRLVDTFVERPSAQIADPIVGIVLFLALLLGAIISAIGSRQLEFSFARRTWIRNVLGGLLMGFGAMMVPGGNAALILHDLPSLSVRAILAYLAMVTGIAVSLAVMMRMTGQSMSVRCAGDFCAMDKHSAAPRSPGRPSEGEA